VLINGSRPNLRGPHRELLISACKAGRIDWSLVYSAAIEHRVAPLVYRNLQGCGVADSMLPGEVSSAFRDLTRGAVVNNLHLVQAIARAAAFFDQREHEVLLVKHAALSVRMRGLFELTMSDDTDLVIRPRGEHPDLIKAPRYRWSEYNKPDPTWELVDAYYASDEYRRHELIFEIDNRIHHDIMWNGVISIDFRKVWAEAEGGLIEGISVLVPDIPDMILMSAINLFRKRHIRLRNVVEIGELCDQADEPEWDALHRKARDYGCESLVFAALHTSMALFGADICFPRLEAFRPGALRSIATAFVTRRISPCAGCRSHGPGPGRPLLPARRGPGDLARRALALSPRQLARHIIFAGLIPRMIHPPGC
jgi:hypothetical protein